MNRIQTLLCSLMTLLCCTAVHAQTNTSFTDQNINYTAKGGLRQFTDQTATRWDIQAAPEWCPAYGEGTVLNIKCRPNPELQGRSGQVIVKMTYRDGGATRTKTATFSVSQDAKTIEQRQIHFDTTPKDATVSFPDDGITGTAADYFTLPEGSHKAIISKPMFKPAEVSIFVNRDDTTSVITDQIRLEPEFSTLKISLVTSDGSKVAAEDIASLNIGEHSVDITPFINGMEARSFSSSEAVEYFSLYEDGIIPVEPGTYEISVATDKYLPYSQNITIGQFSQRPVDIFLAPKAAPFTAAVQQQPVKEPLPGTYPLNIRTDYGDALRVLVTDKSGNVLTDKDALNNSPVYLPYGKYNLKLFIPEKSYEMYNYYTDEKLVYKGALDFHGQESVKKLTYTRSGHAIISAIWYPSGLSFTAGADEFNALASANLLKFRLFDGFTTSLVKADVYKNASATADLQYLFSGTIALLNGEMRVGGAIMDNLDISLLGTYSWLPNLDKANIIPMDYLNGWNYFFGVELSSRIPVINGTVRLGYQGLNGKVSHYDKSAAAFSSVDPVSQGAFVVGLGINLGGNDSKGVSILRVF